METRGTGLTPQRMPEEWEKRPLNMSHEDPGSPGPEVTSKPTSRSLAPLPGDVNTVVIQGGDFVGQQISSRPGMRQQGATPPTNQGIGGTDDDVLISDGFGPEDTDHHTGKPTQGTTKGRGRFDILTIHPAGIFPLSLAGIRSGMLVGNSNSESIHSAA